MAKAVVVQGPASGKAGSSKVFSQAHTPTRIVFPVMNRVAVAVALLLLVSGCTSKSSEGPIQSSGPPGSSPGSTPAEDGEPGGQPGDSPGRGEIPVAPQLVECRDYPIAFQVSKTDIAPKLPSGYNATGPFIDDLVRVNLDAYVCKSVILNNETVLPNVSFALTRASIDVNKTLRGDANFQDYLFEFFTNEPKLRDVFSASGLPAALADVSITGAAPDVRISVGVDGSAWYEATVAGGVKPASDLSNAFREHHLKEGGRPSWADFNLTYSGTSDVASVTLKVSNGFLKGVKTGDQGAMEGIVTPGIARGSISFGHL